MSRSQQGLSFFGALIVLAIIAAGGYFGYQWYMGREDLPTCKDDLTGCIRMCRRLSSESADVQKCQDRCENDRAECERKIGAR